MAGLMIDYTRKHLGFYEVEGKIYRNKVMALQASKPGHWPKWNFNHDVFGKFDWKTEPIEGLFDLYKQRAQQLRQKYDRLILFYSGGIDSTCMLRTFVENNIKLDLIVSYGSFGFYDWKNQKRNQEIQHVAIPEIKKILNDHNYHCPYVLIDDWHLFKKFQDESWVFSTSSSSVRPETYVYNFYHTDPIIQKIMEQGSTAILRGMDKPKLIYEEDTKKWSLRFLDKQAGGADTSGLSNEINKWYNIEYFYWTRDLPKLLSKQAHIIKNFFQKNNDQKLIRSLFSIGEWGDSKIDYNDWIDPLIYSRYLTQQPGQKRNYFTMGKSPFINATVKDIDFFEHGDQHNIDVWNNGVDYILETIDHSFMDGYDQKNKISRATFISKGFTGIWSYPYYLN